MSREYSELVGVYSENILLPKNIVIKDLLMHELESELICDAVECCLCDIPIEVMTCSCEEYR
jgi:hypothetical protein